MARGRADFTIDDSELAQLEADLRGAPGRVQRALPKTIMAGAKVVDREMRIDAAGHKGNWFGWPGTEYVTPTPRVSHELIKWDEAEIGIENKGVGKLFHIIAYGSVNNEPVYDHTAALTRSTPPIVREFADMLEDATLGAGGGDHT